VRPGGRWPRLLGRLVELQWEEIDAQLVARYRTRHAAGSVVADGWAPLLVASRFGTRWCARDNDSSVFGPFDNKRRQRRARLACAAEWSCPWRGRPIAPLLPRMVPPTLQRYTIR
jgi:hypothetical protein